MKFLVDESVGRSVVRYLRSLGYDVISVQESCQGIEDSEICAWASREERDHGLGYYQRNYSSGYGQRKLMTI